MSHARLLTIHALSPIHCGTGQSVGGIDLPIAREKPTGIPYIPGSGIKGVLRAQGASGEEGMHVATFGPDTRNASDHAGGVQFSDANLVLLPVRSLKGTLAWATSPYLVARLRRDLAQIRADRIPEPVALPSGVKEAIVAGDALVQDKKIVFEDLDFEAKVDVGMKPFAEAMASLVPGADDAYRAFVASRVCLLHDDVLAYLLETAMEITYRIKLEEDTKTVQKGGLWCEEALPVESVLAGVVVATPVRRNGSTPDAGSLLDHVSRCVGGGVVQFGGGASVGRGMCRVALEG